MLLFEENVQALLPAARRLMNDYLLCFHEKLFQATNDLGVELMTLARA